MISIDNRIKIHHNWHRFTLTLLMYWKMIILMKLQKVCKSTVTDTSLIHMFSQNTVPNDDNVLSQMPPELCCEIADRLSFNDLSSMRWYNPSINILYSSHYYWKNRAMKRLNMTSDQYEKRIEAHNISPQGGNRYGKISKYFNKKNEESIFDTDLSIPSSRYLSIFCIPHVNRDFYPERGSEHMISSLDKNSKSYVLAIISLASGALRNADLDLCFYFFNLTNKHELVSDKHIADMCKLLDAIVCSDKVTLDFYITSCSKLIHYLGERFNIKYAHIMNFYICVIDDDLKSYIDVESNLKYCALLPAILRGSLQIGMYTLSHIRRTDLIILCINIFRFYYLTLPLKSLPLVDIIIDKYCTSDLLDTISQTIPVMRNNGNYDIASHIESKLKNANICF